jgi:TrwC relaxase/AAA domain/UvrD-like helicase C-terminal domain
MTAEITAAHDSAVDAALGYLERHAAVSRRGHNGTEQVSADGFIAAAFRHRTSRAADPHLHTHALVPNMVRSAADGRWRTLDARHLYAHSLTAGYVYESHLRDELTRRLGVTWGPIVNGIADIDGLTKPVLRAFSTRREDIEHRMAALGTTSARGAEIAALDTRAAKDHTLNYADLVDNWAHRAAKLNVWRTTIDGLADHQPRTSLAPGSPDEVRRIEAQLLGPDGLTERASTFDRRDVVRTLASAYPNGATVALLEAHADAILRHGDVVKVIDSTTQALRSDSGRTVTRVDTGARYSTKELMAIERRLVDAALARMGDGTAVVPTEMVDAALDRRPTLAMEQVALVEELTTGGDGVAVVVAPAGAGKTFALAAAVDGWQSAGVAVHGAALSARAAAELEASTGVASTTLARLVVGLETIRPGDVVIIDEFGMAPTRLVAPIFDRATQVDAKLVLVGDPRQLPEIGAGGLLSGLAARLPLIELMENRRQRNEWERVALEQLRSGDVGKALTAYQEHDRMRTYETAHGAKAHVVNDWLTARADGTDVIMVASRNADIADLNNLAHRHLVDAGIVQGPARMVEVDDRRREFQAGDEVLFLRNDRRLGVRNGMRATIERVHPMGSVDLTVTTTDRQRIDVPRWYVDQGHLAHGYAMTIHKAQGLTCDTALVYATDDLYRELGYVALSRGRDLNVIYTTGDVKIDPEAHMRTPQRVPSEMLMAGLSTSRAQELAIDVADRGAEVSIERLSTPALITERERLQLLLDAAPAIPPGPYTHDVEYTERNLRMTEQHIQELEERKRPLRERLRGTDPELDRAIALRDALQGDMADHRSLLQASEDGFAARKRYLTDHDGDRREIERIDELLGTRALNAVADAMIETPEYLQDLIGEYRSAKHKGRWIDVATQVETYRQRHGITDLASALGVEPPGVESYARKHAHDEVQEALEPPTARRGLRMR